jgi:undecaprenyl diphosphate synthase
MSKLLPSHVGIIMDGNGRWAQKRLKPRSFGHYEGLKAAKNTAAHISTLGIPYLTFFVFSTENWKRPTQEVTYLMELVKLSMKKEFPFFDKNNLRITCSGDLPTLPTEVQAALNEAVDYTADHTGTTINLALNYGGRSEIVRSVNRLISQKQPDGSVTFEDIQAHLDHPDFPDVDLVIRTAGEKRLSNFLLWQTAYAEYHFTETLWPDFGAEEIDKALAEYSRRTRKFGGTSA